jgi:hypothetical protein
MTENVNKAGNSNYNQNIVPAVSELTSLEKIMLVGMVSMSIVAVFKVRAQHKQLTRTFDLLGTSLEQVAALTAQRATK